MNIRIEETFLVTEEDFINMQLSKIKYLTPKENILILRIMGIIAILCGTAAFINVRGNIYQIICWFLLIAIGLFCLSYYDVINPVIIRKQAGKFYHFNQKAINSKTIRLDHQEFSITDEEHTIKLPVQYIYQIAETSSTVLIFFDKEEFGFVPKRILSEEQLELVREFFEEINKYKNV